MPAPSLVFDARTHRVLHSVTGVTGARAHLPTGLEKFIRRVRRATGKPLSVGFGISSTEQVQAVARIADGVVVGSAFMNAIDEVRAGMKSVDKGGTCMYPEAFSLRLCS